MKLESNEKVTPVHVPTAGVENFSGEFVAISEKFGEIVELSLPYLWKFNTGLFDFLDDWKETIDIVNEILCA